MVTPLRVTFVAHFNRSVEVCEKKKVEKARREETQNSYTIKKKLSWKNVAVRYHCFFNSLTRMKISRK